MKKIYLATFIFVLCMNEMNAAVPKNDELLQLHKVTTSEMNAIATPFEGTILFNTDDSEVYERNASHWNKISSDGSDTKIIAGNGINVTGSGTSSDPYQISVKTPYDCATGAQSFSSCQAVTSTIDGEYCIDHDGAGGNEPYVAYCDMNIDGGGWSRVVRTTGNNHQFGQQDDNIDYEPVTSDTGIYLTYNNIKNFSKVMIKEVGTSDYASYDLVSAVSGESIYDLMTFTKNQTMHVQDDAAFDGVRVKGLTSEYSGIKTSGTINYNYFFMSGINEDRDNDQAYMSFSDSTGSNNNWNDGWRGVNQAGTVWSLLNGDYYINSNYHIGNGYSEAGAGYKGNNNGTYEVYIK